MIGSEMQKLFQNHWKLHTKLLNWSFSLLNVIHIFEESTKQSKAIAKHTDTTFKKMKTDKNRHLFWEDVKQKETNSDVDALQLPWKRRAPEYANDDISNYRRIYFEYLDCIINAIENRFEQEDFRTYAKL